MQASSRSKGILDSDHEADGKEQIPLSPSGDQISDDFDDDGFAVLLRYQSNARGFLNPRYLFPCHFRKGFTTAPIAPGLHKRIAHYPLSDSVLNVAKHTPGLSHNVVETTRTAPGTNAWEAVYPEGSINPKNTIKGGFGFYMAGPRGDYSFEEANEILFSYAVYFEPDFDFNKGGKLPGPYGGETPEIAYGCSGGRQTDRGQCFSLRLMWRQNGDGEIYAYLPVVPENDDVLCKVPPKSHRNPDYGFSVGRGAWRFVPGEWAVLAQRVKLNDIGKANGEIELWVNGESVIKATDIVIRLETEASVVRGAHFQTFFGGSSPEWASPKTQRAYFADVSAAIIR